MHGEEPAADQIRLDRLAQAQRHIRLAHAEIELVLGEDHLHLDVGIKLEELAEPRRQPIGADAVGRGDAQLAMRLLAAVGEPRLDRVELHRHFAHGAQQKLALFGQDQAARMAVEERHREVLLQRAHLAAHRRLAEPQSRTGMGEGARLRRRMKDAQLVPVHGLPSI